MYLNYEIERASGNMGNLCSPMSNSGTQFHLPEFSARAYDWAWDLDDGADYDPDPNFEWKDVKIWWYKYCGRGMYSNRKLTAGEASDMLVECLKAVRDWESEEEQA